MSKKAPELFEKGIDPRTYVKNHRERGRQYFVFTYDDIAALFGVTPATVRNWRSQLKGDFDPASLESIYRRLNPPVSADRPEAIKAGKRRAMVRLTGRTPVGAKLWAYGYADLAILLGTSEEAVRQRVCRGDFDPGDLISVWEFCQRLAAKPLEDDGEENSLAALDEQEGLV